MGREEEEGLTIRPPTAAVQALDLFYRSETCRRFHDEETGLYLQGNLYVLNDFLAEISSSGVV